MSDTNTQAATGTDFTALLAQVADGVVQRELDNVNPFDQVRLVADSGYGKLRLPVDKGGQGYTLRQLFGAVIDLAAADPIVAHILRTHYWYIEDLLVTDSPLATRLLDEASAGKLFGNATSERTTKAAGDFEFTTTLAAQDDHFRLNGEKYYTTGTLFTDYVGVQALKGTTLSQLIIPTDREGVEIIDDWEGFGQRRTGSGTTRFTDARVEADEILHEVELDAANPPSSQFAFVQLYLHAIVAGILRRVVEDAKGLIEGRVRSFSHAQSPVPAEDPFLQQVVGELASYAFVAESAVLVAAESLDAAADSTVNGVQDPELAQAAALAASKVKVVLDDLGTRAATVLFEAGGASASGRSKALDRHWRNIRTATLHNPARLKAQAVGANILLGHQLPTNGYF
ncbi:oxidoreductase [Gordonia soli]|uniref:Putative oxidoreductase n=1 Tax=Gordonia soli NBRC 108243 TaxID=1223545 RepID=M0QLI5_9ACTN|nr:oxidoreductase [Gordonia soli]GAC69171.1 putative oxidoreductase [Gordonia soli NBRC 108243]